MGADPSATTGRPSRRAAATSGRTSIREEGFMNHPAEGSIRDVYQLCNRSRKSCLLGCPVQPRSRCYDERRWQFPSPSATLERGIIATGMSVSEVEPESEAIMGIETMGKVVVAAKIENPARPVSPSIKVGSPMTRFTASKLSDAPGRYRQQPTLLLPKRSGRSNSVYNRTGRRPLGDWGGRSQSRCMELFA